MDCIGAETDSCRGGSSTDSFSIGCPDGFGFHTGASGGCACGTGAGVATGADTTFGLVVADIAFAKASARALFRSFDAARASSFFGAGGTDGIAACDVVATGVFLIGAGVAIG